MGQKQCGKCGEFVDEAKAFCPGCGSAFVDEKKRTSVSDFDRGNPTVNLGSTMFNQMLSDMGLNISKDPNKSQPQKGRVEVVTPVVQSAPQSPVTPAPQPKQSATRSRSTWVIVAIIAGILLLVAAAIIVLVAFILYFRLTG